MSVIKNFILLPLFYAIISTLFVGLIGISMGALIDKYSLLPHIEWGWTWAGANIGIIFGPIIGFTFGLIKALQSEVDIKNQMYSIWVFILAVVSGLILSPYLVLIIEDTKLSEAIGSNAYEVIALSSYIILPLLFGMLTYGSMKKLNTSKHKLYWKRIVSLYLKHLLIPGLAHYSLGKRKLSILYFVLFAFFICTFLVLDQNLTRNYFGHFYQIVPLGILYFLYIFGLFHVSLICTKNSYKKSLESDVPKNCDAPQL